MMGVGDMVDRCTNAMGSMMGGSVMGNSILPFVLLVLLFVWLVGLAAVGALLFWVTRRLSEEARFGGG